MHYRALARSQPNPHRNANALQLMGFCRVTNHTFDHFLREREGFTRKSQRYLFVRSWDQVLEGLWEVYERQNTTLCCTVLVSSRNNWSPLVSTGAGSIFFIFLCHLDYHSLPGKPKELGSSFQLRISLRYKPQGNTLPLSGLWLETYHPFFEFHMEKDCQSPTNFSRAVFRAGEQNLYLILFPLPHHCHITQQKKKAWETVGHK